LVYVNVTVIGLGYVGLPTAIIFANKGFNVIGFDTDENKVNLLNQGITPIKEPGLDAMLKNALRNGNFCATLNGVEAVKKSDVVVITVPTPIENGKINFKYLIAALKTVNKGIHKDMLIVVESTIPPTTTERIVKPIIESSGLKVEKDVYLAHVPERIAPGNSIRELQTIPRIIGGVGQKSACKALEVYGKVNPNLVITDATTAEFVKLIENAYRDINIAFANLIALIAEDIGVDIKKSIELANTHPRVNILKPGPGVGGPCLTKDPYLLIYERQNIFGISFITKAREINDYMTIHSLNKISFAIENHKIKKPRISVFGAAYKGGVGDTRKSPSKTIIKYLLENGFKVIVFDPYTEEAFGGIKARNVEEAVNNSDILVIATDHPEFKELNLKKIRGLMRTPIIVDLRRIIDPNTAKSLGFEYYGIGVPFKTSTK